jgi:hypothetical protein
MKSCPVCQTRYTDPTLRFCLQDGAALNGDEPRQSSVETLAFSAPVTIEKIRPTAEMRFDAPDAPPAFQNPAAGPAPASPRKTPARVAALIALPLALAFGAAGAGGWFYLKNQRAATAAENPVSPVVAAANSPAAEAPLSVPVAEELGASNEELKKEIAAVVESWRAAAEARNAAEFAGKYAETVDYFDQNAAGLAEVRAEAQKIFTAYAEIEIGVTNLRVAADAGGRRATAVFDKEWSYETAAALTEGKAHVKLSLQKFGGDWKIVGEKHLKVYYLEN